VFNFLLSDARVLYANYGTELAWLTRRAPFAPAHLVDDIQEETTPDDVPTSNGTGWARGGVGRVRSG
jgi:predicted glutamine amidotransferase